MLEEKSILEVVYESAKDLQQAGIIDKKQMKEFTELCLTEEEKMK